MIACLDVDYRDPGAVAAGLWFQRWQDSTSSAEVVLAVEQVAPYRSGELYRREPPCLLAVLEKGPPAEIVVVDGYVWLARDRCQVIVRAWRMAGVPPIDPDKPARRRRSQGRHAVPDPRTGGRRMFGLGRCQTIVRGRLFGAWRGGASYAAGLRGSKDRLR